MGNLLGESAGDERIALRFIDFEKSVALRQFPSVSTPAVPPGDLWPRGELGSMIRGWGYLHPPQDLIRKIADFNREHIRLLLVGLAEAANVTWLDGSVDTLAARAAKIGALVEDVWRPK